MIYECVFHNGKFLTAKPKGWVWGEAERVAPFSIHETPDLTPGDVEFMVEVEGVAIEASRIAKNLVREE
jgi:hypothetical protein